MINSDMGRKQKIPKDIFTREYYNNFQINYELLQMVSTLKGNGYGTCVLSNSIYPFSQYNRKIGLYKSFDYVLLSDEIGFSKPDKRAFLFALDTLNLTAGDLVFIDDKQENIDMAKILGFVTHKYQDNLKLQMEFIRMGLLNK
jgi:putative hydrolase of the HAD superfamily